MKQHVICYMAVSIDGRTLPRRWRPDGAQPSTLYEALHAQLEGQAWLVGRVTGQEFAKGAAYLDHADDAPPRENWLRIADAGAYGVVLDAHGKIAWGRGDIDGDPIAVVLTHAVSDAHLAGLRRDGVSYIFAGQTQVDLPLALEILRRDLKIERLLVEGGGHINGAFLRAGLVDEVSLLVLPVIDGTRGAPSVFDGDDADGLAPIKSITLESSTVLEGGAVWLRYSLQAL
jgi:riboflavin biosynthesis pyrimidine reductase